MQIIPDTDMETGLKLITQKDHGNGDRFSVFEVRGLYGEEVKQSKARWRLAQWDSGPDLSTCLAASSPDTVTDGEYRTFAFDTENKVMTFALDTSAYYKGEPAKQGDYWPHLLIVQEDFGYSGLDYKTKSYYSCSSKNLIFSMDIRLGYYEKTPVDGDYVRAAQFLLFFYVKGIKTDDFCWFGLQLFDSRREKSDTYVGIDTAKADASGSMIYSIGSWDLYPTDSLWKNGAIAPNGEWVHIEIDLRPFLDDMLQRGRAVGYFKATSLDMLCINGMNMGWETIGTFDHTMYVKNLSLVSYPEGK